MSENSEVYVALALGWMIGFKIGILFTIYVIKDAIKRLCQQPQRVRTIGAKAHTLIGKGDGARAVAEILTDR